MHIMQNLPGRVLEKTATKTIHLALKQLTDVWIIITQEQSKESEDNSQKSNYVIKAFGNILFENRLSLFKLNGYLYLLPF